VPSYYATLEACNLRLRPIIMTSCSRSSRRVTLMLLGRRPARGEMRRTLGRRCSRVLGVTLFGIFMDTRVLLRDSAWFATAGEAGGGGGTPLESVKRQATPRTGRSSERRPASARRVLSDHGRG